MDRNTGIDVDPLFVGPTRPTTVAGVTWPAFVVNTMVTIQAFIWTSNLLWLLLFIPTHSVFYLICRYDPRAFELLALWGPTKGRALVGNLRFWCAATSSPLQIATGKPSHASKRRLKELLK